VEVSNASDLFNHSDCDKGQNPETEESDFTGSNEDYHTSSTPSSSEDQYWCVIMTRRKPGKWWRRTDNVEEPNKRPRRTAQLSSLPAASNVHVESDQQYLAQGSVARESILTVDSLEDNEEPSSRSAFRDPPDGLTTEPHDKALSDVGDWTYDDGHMFSEGFEEGLSEECAEE
ncbi:hypothetical protein JOB18_009851, partial [Solea senegalensis]